jgi:hypothetical protein
MESYIDENGQRNKRNSDRMVFVYTSTYTYSAYYMYISCLYIYSYYFLPLLIKSTDSSHDFGEEVYLIQHYMIKFISGLW